MARLELKVLGGFQANLAPGSTINLPTRKAQALLAHLALTLGTTHPRDRLATLLWSDVPESQARRSLRKTLFSLRDALSGTDALTADRDTVGLNASAVRVDANEFEQLVVEDSIESLEKAVDLYQGDLLAGLTMEEGPFEEWLVVERERLRELLIEALARLLARQRDAGSVEGAILSALRLLAVDPLQEPVHRTLMRLYVQTGRRAAALRQYQACAAVLERELHTQPEEATRALYREILQARSVTPAPQGSSPPTPIPVPPAVFRPALAPPLAADAPLIGRQDELSRLTARLHEAWSGGGRLASIVGEAGVGKSRLAAAVRAVAAERGGRVLVGRCYESEQSLPFSPWIDALRGARLAPNSDVVTALAPVWRSELARLLPELTDEPMPPADPTDALRLFEAVAQCLDVLAERAPLLIVLEDLQWADELSLRLGGFLARRTRTGPLLILATTRQEEVDAGGMHRSVGDPLAREGLLMRVFLSRLTRDETAALTRELARESRTTSLAELEEDIWRVSEGNPFMVVETVRAWREHGGPPGIADEPIPARVRNLVARRLRRLSERGRNLVDVAAVIGRRFEFALLQRASALDESEAADGVEELVRHRILEEAAGGFEFTHDRIRETRRSDLLAPLRALLHRRVAEAIESMHPTDVRQHALALGTHYREAGEWERAVTHLRQAGLVAASRYAGREAAACFEEALRALTHQPDTRRAAEQRFELSLSLARTRYWFGHFDRAMSGYREAERLAHALGDDRRLGQVLGSLVYLLASEGRYGEAIDAGARALTIAAATADRSLEVWTSIGLGRSYFAVGDYQRGAEQTARLAETMDEAELDEYLRPGALRPSVGCRTWLALCLERLGSFKESLRWAEDAVRIADAIESLQAQVWAWYTLGQVHLGPGDVEASITALERARALSEQGELPIYRPRVLGALGQALRLAGKIDAGLGLIARALDEAGAARVVYGYTGLLVAQAEAQLDGEQVDEAATIAAEALRRARELGERGDEACALEVLGAVALRRGGGTTGEAVMRFEEAIARAREVGMRPLEARSLAGLGHAHLAAGKPQDALPHLAEAVRLLRSNAMHRWLAPTEALLAAAGRAS